MATLHRSVLGGAVTIYPNGAVSGTVVQAIFRDRPVPSQDAYSDGEVLLPQPILRGDRTELAGLVPGDIVEPGNGKSYIVVDPIDEGSPASDGMVAVALKLST